MPNLRIILVVLLLLSLAIVFFAPSMHAEPTALRAARQAALVFLAIFAAARSVSFYLTNTIWSCKFPSSPDSDFISDDESGLLDLYCSRLC